MKNNTNAFIIVASLFVLAVFTSTIAKNLLPSSSNNQYYAKPNEEMTAQIDTVSKENGKIIIKTKGNPIEYCLKTTKSTPSNNSICWNKIENNKATSSFFEYKKYYIWIKDEEGRVSSRFFVE